MKVANEGYRWARPGEVDRAPCHVCGAACTIERGVLGPTCFAQAIAKRKTLHDAIRCPHSGSDWHNRAAKLKRAIEDSPSERLAAVMREELTELIERARRAAEGGAP